MSDIEVDRKRGEDALAASERDLQLIVDSIPGMIAVFSAAGELQFVNNQVLEYFGATLEELKNWEAGGYTHPEDYARSIEAFMQSIASEHWFDHEVRARRFDGVYRWFHSRGKPLRDASGRIVRWCNLLTDIDDRKRAESERKHAEDALAASERDLRLIVDSIPGMVAVFSAAGEPQFVNKPVLAYFGGPIDVHEKFRNHTHIHPEDRARAVEAFTQSMASGEPFEFEVRAQGYTGVYRWFHSRGKPLRDASGRIARWYNLLTDIDDRKRAEMELKQAHNFLTEAQRLSHTGSFTWDALVDEENWSDEIYRIFDLDPATKVKLPLIRQLVHPEDLPLLEATIERGMKGLDMDLTARIVTPRGAVKHVHVVSHRIRHIIDRPVFIGAIQDVTEMKRSEAALKASEAELRRANEYLTIAQQLSQTGSYTREMATDTQSLSDQMYRICEFDPAKKVTHEMVLSRIHPEDLPAFQEAWRAALKAEEEIKIAYRFVTDSGTVKHFRTVSRPMRGATGGLTYIGATQDVTEIKLVEEAANRARAEFAHVARVSALSALTASIAHEVNQPLAAIITNASTCQRLLAADSPNLDRAKAAAQRTIRDAYRASEVIGRLRALFARKQATMEPLDLNDIALEVLTLSSSELQGRQVAVRTDLAEDLPMVRGDRVQLQQVILNLIRNAADAMSAIHESSRSLTVQTRCENIDWVRLSVRDSGVGIDPQTAEKLFDTFYTTKPEGMGIGLSVSRSIIESHDGRLWANANEGPGATFAFSIPCRLGLAPEIVKSDAHERGATADGSQF